MLKRIFYNIKIIVNEHETDEIVRKHIAEQIDCHLVQGFGRNNSNVLVESIAWKQTEDLEPMSEDDEI